MCSIDNSAAQSKKTLLSYLTQRKIPALRGRWTRRLRRFPFAGGLNARLRYDKRGATPPPAAVPPAPPPPLRGSPPAKGGAPCCPRSRSATEGGSPRPYAGAPGAAGWTPWPRLCRPPGPACSGVGCAPHTRALPGCGAPAAGSLTGMAHSGVESLRAIHGESKWGLRIVLI